MNQHTLSFMVGNLFGRCDVPGLRFGVIGCGAISELFYLPTLAKTPSLCSELHLVDSDPACAAQAAEKFSAVSINTRLEEVLDRIDVAVVATPPTTHFPIASQLIASGKSVFCEKPMTVLPSEAERLVAAAEAAGVTFMTNNFRRSFPSLTRIGEIVRSGELGRLRSFQWAEGSKFLWPTKSAYYFKRSNDGSPLSGGLLDMGAHVLDILCWWLGTPEIIACRTDSFGGPDARSCVRLDFNGVQGEVDFSSYYRMRNGFTLEFEGGSISGSAAHDDRFTLTRTGEGPRTVRLAKRRPDQLLQNFVDACTGKARPLFTARDVLPSVRAIAQAYAMAKPFSGPWLEYHKAAGSPGKTLVTGAAGLLGGAVVEALFFSGHSDVRAGIHRWTNAARIARLPVEIVTCDLTDPAQIAAAVKGVDSIIHCALGGLADIPGNTDRLLATARDAGVRRVVHISSVAVYGDASGIVDETTPGSLNSLTPYGAAKRHAEDICRSYADDLDIVVLRPTLIYGPFSDIWTMAYFTRLRAGRWSEMGTAAEGKCNLVHVNDVANFAIAALSRPGVGGQAFNINGPEVISWNAYFRRFNEKLGLPPLPAQAVRRVQALAILTQPVRSAGKYAQKQWSPQLKWLARRFDRLDRLMRQAELSLRCTPNAQELAGFSHDVIYTTAKAERAFGMRPEINVEKGLNITVAWLKHMDVET